MSRARGEVRWQRDESGVGGLRGGSLTPTGGEGRPRLHQGARGGGRAQVRGRDRSEWAGRLIGGGLAPSSACGGAGWRRGGAGDGAVSFPSHFTVRGPRRRCTWAHQSQIRDPDRDEGVRGGHPPSPSPSGPGARAAALAGAHVLYPTPPSASTRNRKPRGGASAVRAVSWGAEGGRPRGDADPTVTARGVQWARPEHGPAPGN